MKKKTQLDNLIDLAKTKKSQGATTEEIAKVIEKQLDENETTLISVIQQWYADRNNK